MDYKRIILGLDIATHTGWAMQVDGRITTGSTDFSLRDGEGDGMRFVRFKKWLTAMKNTHGDIEHIHYEKVIQVHRSGRGGDVYAGLLATMQVWCEHHDIGYTGASVKGIKKWFTGNGNAKKEAMIDEAIKRGYMVDNHDEADALAVLLFGQREQN